MTTNVPIRRILITAGAIAAALAVIAAVVLFATSAGRDVVAQLDADGVGAGLRLPWQPSLDEQFPPAAECASCHPTEAEAWQASTHARSAQNPLVHASICGRCHAPLGTQFDGEYQLKLYDGVVMPAIPAAAAEGVTCVTCHSATHLPDEQILTFLPTWPNWRTTDLALEVLPFDAALGTFGTGTADDPEPVANESHTSVVDPSLKEPELCRTCHSVVVDKEPLAPHCGLGQARVRLLTTYDEWLASPYPDTDRTCQSCHMAADSGLGAAAVAPEGTEYELELPDRALANHTITGLSSDYLSTGPEVALQEQRVVERLAGAATVALSVPAAATLGRPLDVTVTVTNTGAGHDLPTGFAFWSEAWLEVTATDDRGTVYFASGDLDDEGWLRDEFNPRVVDGTLDYDAYLVSLRARLVTVGPNRAGWRLADGTIAIPPSEVPRNLNGTPIIGPTYNVAATIMRKINPEPVRSNAGIALQESYVLRFADTILRNGIPAAKARRARYPISLGPAATGTVSITARLLIRSQWPWMLGQQEELPTPRPRPRVYEIAAASASVPIGAPE